VIEQIRKVQEFHQVFNCYRNIAPIGRIPDGEREVRVRLMQEELDEYRAAAEDGDLVEIADALSDLLYVVYGTLVAHGLVDSAEELFAEVHRSNMSKLDEQGRPIYRQDGKVLKSVRFTPPDLISILQKYLPQDNGAQGK
jgi:predicted HAD superfamily Cof-like phosphohydrolase